MSNEATKNILIRSFINQLLPKKVIKMINMLESNKKSSILTNNSESQNKIKHINIIYHHIDEKTNKKKESLVE